MARQQSSGWQRWHEQGHLCLEQRLSLGTTLQVSSSLLLVSEDTSGLHDIVSTSLTARDLLRVPDAEDSDRLLTEEKGLGVLDADATMLAVAVHGVVLEHVGLGSTSEAGSPATSPVLGRWPINSLLGGCDGMNRGIFAWSRDYVFGTTLLFKGKMQLAETGNWNLEKASELI